MCVVRTGGTCSIGSLTTWPQLANSARSELSVVVLDASAAVEIVLWTDEGSELATHVLDAEEVVVPDHFHVEGVAALRRMELRGELTPTDTRTALGQLLALRVRRIDTLPLLLDAWKMRHNITAADALYVIIARRLGVALVTGDIRLAHAPGLDVNVITSSPLSR
ncbi:MAG: type II toxin-antitoxin system VapC family toxin [Mycobacteriales bacterium]